jgi:hypothetical protein
VLGFSEFGSKEQITRSGRAMMRLGCCMHTREFSSKPVR